jgi:hypothetical protein
LIHLPYLHSNITLGRNNYQIEICIIKNRKERAAVNNPLRNHIIFEEYSHRDDVFGGIPHLL